MSRAKPLAALSVDMDDLWSYMKTAGESDWQSYPSFMSSAMPRLFNALDRHGMGITAFVIGEDVKRPAVRPWLAEFVRRGHELANHSFAHDAAYVGQGKDIITAELQAVEDVVAQEFGVTLKGYRGPSFSYSKDLLEVLRDRGYLYDSSTFPTFLGPLARWYHALASKKQSNSNDAGSDHLFGSWSEGFRSLGAYRWDLGGNGLMELPTTTMPVFRIPIHGTYLHFLADVSEGLAMTYARMALGLCRLTGTPPVFLLHASDFIGCDDVQNPSVIPGMKRTGEQKAAFMDRLFALLVRHYRVVDMQQLAQSLDTQLPLKPAPTH